MVGFDSTSRLPRPDCTQLRAESRKYRGNRWPSRAVNTVAKHETIVPTFKIFRSGRSGCGCVSGPSPEFESVHSLDPCSVYSMPPLVGTQ